MIYLDYNATTPVDETVLATMLPYFGQHYGNPSNTHHSLGLYAETAVQFARTQVATAIGASPEEIIFTSGATEGLNFALRGVAAAYKSKGNHIISVHTEHKAVLETLKDLERHGITHTLLPVDADGLINVQDLTDALTPNTIAVCVMWANNETGVLQDIPKIAEICREKKIIFITDATQAIGKVPVHVTSADILVASGHKFYAPKGVGFVYLRRRNPRVQISPFITGGGQERGLRGGTTNVPLIVGIGKAIEIASNLQHQEFERLLALSAELQTQLKAFFPNLRLNGHPLHRMPNTINLCFAGHKSADMLKKLRDVALSAGSACASKNEKPSHVLTAMGLSETDARASLRISLGRFTTLAEITQAAQRIIAATTQP